MIKWHFGPLLLSLFVASFAVSAHHSRAAFFDMSKVVELEGEITRVQWRHPHVRYWIQADNAYGGAVWEMETTPPSLLEPLWHRAGRARGGYSGPRGRAALEGRRPCDGGQSRSAAGTGARSFCTRASHRAGRKTRSSGRFRNSTKRR